MPQETIAIICDCDGTLCPDTTDKLVRDLGIDSSHFWKNEVDPMVKDGWDPPLAYLNKLLEMADGPDINDLTRSAMNKSAAEIEFFPGALDFVQRIESQLLKNPDYREAGVSLEWYIVSAGIEEVLRSTPLGDRAQDIFGCAFEYSHDERAIAVKRAVTFTEKTKFIFAINKGITGEQLRRDPYRVNDAMVPAARRIPFENMVYVGDGPTDIPCFSMIRHLEGKAVGVMPPDDLELRKPYELAEGNRLTVGPYTADYSDGTDLFRMMTRVVTSIADSIVVKREQRPRRDPTH